jgi:hypothetical protein
VADLCCQYTFSSVVINNSSTTADSLITDFDDGEILGLDGAPIRRQIDPQGQSDGGIPFNAFFGARVITFTGKVAIVSVADPGGNPLGVWAAINTLEAATISALEAVRNSPTNLTWTPTGGSGKSISCQYGVPGGEIQFTGNLRERRFTFQLVAATPTIS